MLAIRIWTSGSSSKRAIYKCKTFLFTHVFNLRFARLIERRFVWTEDQSDQVEGRQCHLNVQLLGHQNVHVKSHVLSGTVLTYGSRFCLLLLSHPFKHPSSPRVSQVSARARRRARTSVRVAEHRVAGESGHVLGTREHASLALRGGEWELRSTAELGEAGSPRGWSDRAVLVSCCSSSFLEDRRSA